MVDDVSSGVTFLVAEGVAGICPPKKSTGKSARSFKSIEGVLNPVMASGEEAVGVDFSRS